MISVIDNYDSFVYNIEQYIGEFYEVEVKRYNSIPESDGIVFSPGPGIPSDFPVMNKILSEKQVPILGICLGHQAIAEFFGGNIKYANKVVHGKKSDIHHIQTDLFNDLPNPMEVGRYHSLIVDNVPKEIDIIAKSSKNKIMALKHCSKPIYGLQFHPESILTPNGKDLIKNFIDIVEKY